MIFRDATTRRIYDGLVVTGIPSDVQQLARRRLRILDNVADLGQLFGMPRARPRRRRRAERLACYAVPVAGGWELRFQWRRGIVDRVELVDRRPSC